jgi:hypothetical protein
MTMSSAARVRPLWFLLLALLACDGGPSGPSTGNLRVTVLGLPNGSPAAITISGPDGFSQPATATQTFIGLTPGTYTIAATSVTVSGSLYDPSPASQTVTVAGSDAQATASVFYSQASGTLTVTINGLGTNKAAAVTVTGPGGYNEPLNATTTLSGLDPGDYTIVADSAAPAGCSRPAPTPTTQNATVVARMTTNATVTYNAPGNDGNVNLCIAGMYLTQSVQDLGGTIPLVQNRDGYLRVFVVADRANTATPAVDVRFYNGLTLLSTITIPPSGFSTPTAIDESSLSFSWDTTVSGAMIQPGLAIQAEVNPSGIITETNPADNLYPSTGPLPLTVRTVPTLDVTFVPVRQFVNGLQGRVTAANKDSFLVMTQKMHPIDTFNAVLHAPYTTQTSSTLQANNANGAWGTILGEIDALRVSESSARYYYGVARVTYSSGVAGVAYVSIPGTTPGTGARAALGWDYLPSGSIVAAHELGHNWARNHAPCGGPAGVDPQYPRPDGSTGTYGFDLTTKTLEPSTLPDIMGYCDPKWISDYTYRGVMDYLLAPSPPSLGMGSSPDVQPCLLVWGHIEDGAIVLEPAFQVDTRPSLPSQRGPYSLKGIDANGNSVFELSFAPTPVADARQTQENFVFAVPLSNARAARLSSIRVAGRGRRVSLTEVAATVAQPGGPTQPDLVEARRAAGGGVTVRWNHRTHPMVMVRDSDTGEVLSFARSGEVQVSTPKGRIDLVMSNGLRSQVKRMRIAQ